MRWLRQRRVVLRLAGRDLGSAPTRTLLLALLVLSGRRTC